MRTLLVALLLLGGCRCAPPPRDVPRRRPPEEPAAPGPPPVVREVRIRVYDSGREPDDAFRLAINGVSQGVTPLGGERIFTVSLTKGRHTLTLTGSGAPDGQGTYAIESEGPLT